MLSLKEGTLLVKTARKTIETHLREGVLPPTPNVPKELVEKLGVFVTLTKRGELRGCIGQPLPTMPLIEALMDSAVCAATEDPRFQPMRIDELSEVEIEVSVLTKPEILKVKHPKEYPEQIIIGRDGLIVDRGGCAGLLLPQVPAEYNWDAEEFLSNTCLKAGLTPDCWLDRSVRIRKFSAQVFSERGVDGEVEERKLT